jgi:hypothetical protein
MDALHSWQVMLQYCIKVFEYTILKLALMRACCKGSLHNAAVQQQALLNTLGAQEQQQQHARRTSVAQAPGGTQMTSYKQHIPAQLLDGVQMKCHVLVNSLPSTPACNADGTPAAAAARAAGSSSAGGQTPANAVPEVFYTPQLSSPAAHQAAATPVDAWYSIISTLTGGPAGERVPNAPCCAVK